MNILFKYPALLFFLSMALISCTAEEAEPFIKAEPSIIEFDSTAGSDTVTVTMNGKYWEVTSNQPWCTVSKLISTKQEEQVVISISANSTRSVRYATVTFTMNRSLSCTVSITQQVRNISFPDYTDSIAADQTGMTSTSKGLASNMYMGWNMGNSLEVPGGETGWGNPKATQQLLDSVKAAGFNTVRLPCAWNGYIEDATTCKIKDSWLARVKEVVDYCYNNDMYVILNIHWDGGWLEENPTYEMQEVNNLKQKAIWEQIATYFKEYDEHLLFAGTNEVHAGYGNPVTENIIVHQSYLQTFVTAVRSAGGKNFYRHLVVQSYNTNIDLAKQQLKIPTDVVSDRLFVEVHYYSPWDFCGDENSGIYLWGDPFKQYGSVSSWGQEDYVVAQFNLMKTNFVNKGYPVILGEYSAMRRSSLTGDQLTNHLNSRAYFLQYVTEQAKSFGLVPCYWDNGGIGVNGCGIFNRNTLEVFDSQALDALMYGAGKGHYPF